ncbi:MAG: exodeoxyribonuclease VII large subunit, partial [Clostridia bacterium]|nr:exodeoxyribonuclease VII large subunit [Clostridia bacterium]
LRFLELKEKLQKEGLFDEDRKQPVPSFCQKVGIVTSQTGAVIVDITNVALRRQPFCNLYLYPVKVQGDGADVEIAQGINYFAKTDVDAIIVGRGGGSNEDLSVFNSEIIVRAIANCPKPVVSAVGHGVDYTLCDFVADKRAVTPSEAAEFVTTDVNVIKRHIKSLLNKQYSKIEHQLEFDTHFVVNFQKRILSQLTYRVESTKLSVKHTIQNISANLQNAFVRRQMQLDAVTSKLSGVNPINILKRGYAFVELGGAPVKSTNQLQIGDNLTIHIADGDVSATVTDKESK